MEMLFTAPLLSLITYYVSHLFEAETSYLILEVPLTGELPLHCVDLPLRQFRQVTSYLGTPQNNIRVYAHGNK